MPTVYLETTVISYLASRPSRDVVIAGHQKATREWWDVSSNRFDLYVSEAVLLEIERGDSKAVARRKSFVENLSVLRLNSDVTQLGKELGESLGLRGKAKADIAHLAFAVAYEMDFLATWNLKHIASGSTIRRLQEINEENGRLTPVILTPESLIIF